MHGAGAACRVLLLPPRRDGQRRARHAGQMLGWCGITPGVTQDAVQNVIELIVKALVLLGIVVDPTTEGAGDSTQALGYDYPAQTAPTAAAEEIKNTEEGDA